MTKNNKGRAPNQDATPNATDSRNHTGTDPRLKHDPVVRVTTD